MFAAVVGRVLAGYRRLRLGLWALKVRARLRRLGVRAQIAIGPGVRFETLPHLEIDAFGEHHGGTLRIDIGPSVRLGRELTLDLRLGADNALTLGEGAVVQSWVRLQLHGGSIAVGCHTHLRDLVQVKSKSRVVVGDRVLLSRGVIVHGTVGVEIGDDCGIGERASIIDTDHQLDGSGGAFLQAPLLTGPVRLGRGVSVNANCVILRGAQMGDGSALAAGGVLTGEVPPGHLAGGLPARVLKDLRS